MLKYVGGETAYSQGLFVGQGRGRAALSDKSQKPVIMGLVGSTLRSGNYGVLWGVQYLGWNIKWVRGYPSTAELRQALERGEIDMSTFGASRDINDLFATRQFQSREPGRHGEGRQARAARQAFGDAPILADLVKGKIADPAAQKAFDYTRECEPGRHLARAAAENADSHRRGLCQSLQRNARRSAISQPISRRSILNSPVASKADIEALIGKLATVSHDTLEYVQTEIKHQDVDQDELTPAVEPMRTLPN